MKFPNWKPKIICLCGSTRFMKEFRAENLRLTLEGCIVLTVGCDTRSDEELKISADKKQELDFLHLKKIDLANEVRILNVDGYVGESTAREFAYALKTGKVLTWLESEYVSEFFDPPILKHDSLVRMKNARFELAGFLDLELAEPR